MRERNSKFRKQSPNSFWHTVAAAAVVAVAAAAVVAVAEVDSVVAVAAVAVHYLRDCKGIQKGKLMSIEVGRR